jgi:hypothetical protein
MKAGCETYLIVAKLPYRWVPLCLAKISRASDMHQFKLIGPRSVYVYRQQAAIKRVRDDGSCIKDNHWERKDMQSQDPHSQYR